MLANRNGAFWECGDVSPHAQSADMSAYSSTSCAVFRMHAHSEAAVAHISDLCVKGGCGGKGDMTIQSCAGDQYGQSGDGYGASRAA